jgi:ABC-type Fe3+/spermidine/putrescine transport system ATPase subunit
MKDKHLIELIDVSKAYGGDVALSHVDLYIKDGEFLTLLGPSGCGQAWSVCRSRMGRGGLETLRP